MAKKTIPKKSAKKKTAKAEKHPLAEPANHPLAEPVTEAAEEAEAVGLMQEVEKLMVGSMRRFSELSQRRPRSLEAVDARVREAREKLKVCRERIQSARISLIAAIHEEREGEAWLRSLEEMRTVFLDEET